MDKQVQSSAGKSRQTVFKINPKYVRAIRGFISRPVLAPVILSLVTEIILEVLSHLSLVGTLKFIFLSPHLFLFNWLIVFVFFWFATLFRRRIFSFVIIEVLWLASGITDCLLMHHRGMPFSFSDLITLQYGVLIMPRYFSIFQTIILIVGIAILITLCVLLFIHGVKLTEDIHRKRTASVTAAVLAAIIAFLLIGWSTGFLAKNYSDPVSAYEKNGFPYSVFFASMNTGIDKPVDYSPGSVEQIVASLNKTKDKKDKPNIIFLQLESFFDLSRISGLALEENPIPVFTELKKDYSSGYLTVPSIGGGTVNTEYEVMTGMSLDYFSGIEYPYQTYLLTDTSESIAYDLGEQGYATHAIHDFTAIFYKRNQVYANLGFDDFTSIEYMNDVECNQTNWAKDIVLEKYILDALDSTENRDFIFAVSVQGHGSYPTESSTETYDESDDNSNYSIDYYASQLKEMDSFLGSLISSLECIDEDTVLVIYGDHLPALEFTPEQMDTGSLYDSEYIIWSNFDMKKENKNLQAYQLSAYVQNRLDMNYGMFTKYHQQYMDEDINEYINGLYVLQYDALYGDRTMYGGSNPYQAKNLRMGIKGVSVDYVHSSGDTLYIKGDGFTEYCQVQINGVRQETTFVNENNLTIANANIRDGDIITVAVTPYYSIGAALSVSAPYTYNN